MKALMVSLFAASLMLPALAQPSAAQEHERPHGDHRAEGWHGGEIRNFHEHDMERWRGGAWFHGLHDGRAGWWWQVGPTWYFYDAPVYPYPDPYSPPMVAAPGAPPAPAGQLWYYCRNPAGYYPYVPQCGGPWEPVPAG
jgi:hypothetical protein